MRNKQDVLNLEKEIIEKKSLPYSRDEARKELLVSKCFRISKNHKNFEFNILNIGKFKGKMEDLVEKINKSNLTMLKTKSWTEVGAYSISHPNLIKLNENHEVFKILEHFEV